MIKYLIGKLARLVAWFDSKFIHRNGMILFFVPTLDGYYVGRFEKGKREGSWIWYKVPIPGSGPQVDTKLKEEHYTKGNLDYTWYA